MATKPGFDTLVRTLRIGVLVPAAALLTGCPATTSNNTASNQAARTFNRGGEPNNGVFTDSGAGHAAAGNSNNLGGGFGRQASMGGAR